MKKIRVLDEFLDIKVSHTFMQTAVCPYALWCTYVARKKPGAPKVAAIKGGAAHEAIADLTSIAIGSKLPVKDLTDEQVERAVRHRTPQIIMDHIPEVLRVVTLWRDAFRISRHVYGYEEKISLGENYEEAPWSEAWYRGIVDILEINGTHATIIDYKNQKNILSQGDLDEHEQLTFYAWLISKLYTYVESFTCRIWYLQYGKYGETHRTREELEEFERGLMLRIDKVCDIESWDPNPGSACHYCDYKHLCPVAQDLSPENNEVISFEQATKAADEILVMESRIAELKPKLKAWVQSNDEIRMAGDIVYGFKSSTSSSWNAEAVHDTLLGYGHKMSEVANVDSRKMQSFLKKCRDENLRAELEDIEEEKTSTRFSAYKATT